MFRLSLKRLNIKTSGSSRNSTIKLYSFGSGWSGQLCLGEGVVEQHSPKSIKFNDDIELSENDKFKTGSYHSLLVKNNNDKVLYSWGQNNFGQLGIGNNIDQFQAKSTNFNEPIKLIECGAFHSIVSTSDKKTYSFGWNSRLQCGQENENNKAISTPKEIKFLNGVDINSISCGFDYSIISTLNDGVFVFGKNDVGQCSTSNSNSNNDIQTPIIIKSLNEIKIKKISSGWGHTLLLTEDGDILSWGSNLHGQCGTGVKSSIPSPITKIQLPSNLKALDISCGSCASAAILSDKNIYIWGSSGDGKLGLGDNQKDDCLKPTLLPIDEGNNGISKISFGSDHCIALPIQSNNNNSSNNNIFYGWGFGQHGCLGFGSSINQLKVYPKPEINNFFNNNDDGEQVNKIISVQSSLDTSFAFVSCVKKNKQ